MVKSSELNTEDKLCFGFDVAGSGRLDVSQAGVMHTRIFQGVTQALCAQGMRLHSSQLREAGDGGVALVDHCAVGAGALLTTVLPAMADYIHDADPDVLTEPLRLRYVLHAGEVHRDRFGFWGGALGTTFRMLESPGLRTYLQTTGDAGVVAISPNVMQRLTAPESSLTLEQQQAVQGWETLLLHNKETCIRASVAPLLGVAALAELRLSG